MITLLSPSKKLNFKHQDAVSAFTQCDFIQSAQELVNQAKNLTSQDLKDLMKISDSLADLNKERFNNWSLPFNQDNAKQAILAFDGGVYSGLQAETFDQNDLEFAQDHLRILSGLYGVLKPLDLIQPYRLEMGTQLKIGKHKDLYHFWGNEITSQINKDKNNEYLINLASAEYFKSINIDSLKPKLINIIFKEKRNGSFKIIGIHAKKARGLMSRYIIKNKISNPEKLKKFNYEKYKYNSKLSSSNDWVFTR